MVKKGFIRLFYLICIIGVLNVIYSLTFYERDLREKSPEILKIRSAVDSTDIYYFGESSNVTFAPDDSTKKSISDLISLFYPSLRITNINKYATHSGIYKYWVKEITNRQP